MTMYFDPVERLPVDFDPSALRRHRSVQSGLQESGKALLNAFRILGHTDDPPRIVRTENDESSGSVREGAQCPADTAQVGEAALEFRPIVLAGGDPGEQGLPVHQRVAGSRER